MPLLLPNVPLEKPVKRQTYLVEQHAKTTPIPGRQLRIVIANEDAARTNEAGGLAEWLMRNAHAALEGEAVFGYVGDALALRVDLRVGYEPTDHSRVYGLWRPGVSPERRRWLAERVAAFGPF